MLSICVQRPNSFLAKFISTFFCVIAVTFKTHVKAQFGPSDECKQLCASRRPKDETGSFYVNCGQDPVIYNLCIGSCRTCSFSGCAGGRYWCPSAPTPPPTPPPSGPSSEESPMKIIWIIVGVIIALAVVIGAILGCVFCGRVNRNRRGQNAFPGTGMQQPIQGGYNNPMMQQPMQGGYNNPMMQQPMQGGYNNPMMQQPMQGGYNKPYPTMQQQPPSQNMPAVSPYQTTGGSTSTKSNEGV